MRQIRIAVLGIAALVVAGAALATLWAPVPGVPELEAAREMEDRAARKPGAEHDAATAGAVPGAPSTPVSAAPVYLDRAHAPSLQAELAGLGATRYLILEGDLGNALQQLERLAERFPHGALRSERTAELAVVHCALGQREAGQRALASLRAATPAPASRLIEKARAACEP